MKRILVVEDNDSVRGILSAFIEHIPEITQIDSVESAEEALKLFEPGKYILVITDIALIGMNGLELCLKIRRLDNAVKVVGISGYSKLIGTVDDVSIAGFDYWFNKPTDYKDFLITIENIIKKLQ